MSTVTMQELELETAELLPARETLNCCSHRSRRQQLHPGGVRQHAQAGLVNVAVANGSFNNILSLGSGNIL